MDRIALPGMEQGSPAACLEILRLFSKAGNGEATVLLMLRHIAQMAEVPWARVYLPPASRLRDPVVLTGRVDPTTAEPGRATDSCLEWLLCREAETLGRLQFPEPTAVSATELRNLLDPLVDILTIALEKWREEKRQALLMRRHNSLKRRLKRQNRFLDILYRVSLDMAENKDYDSLMQVILRHAQRIMDAAFCSIYIVNEQQGVLEMRFVGPTVDPSIQGLKVKPGEGGAGRVWETANFLVINDYPHWENRVQASWLDRIGTIAFIPLSFSEKFIGVICIGFSDNWRKITPSEKGLLQQFASLAAVVSENVRLINGLTQKEEDFQREIQLAAEVQQAYLPFNHDDPRVRVRGLFHPLEMVSGDLFDYFWSADEDVLFGYVADVTGHGVTAGLRTAALSVLFREAAELSLPLVEKMRWVHGRSLGYFTEGAYFAAICFELDFRLSELRVACGGLYEFFIKTRYYTGKIEMTGSLMGLKKTPTFEERTYPARNGDCFYFLTDGLSEQLPANSFPQASFQESCRCLEDVWISAAAWDDMSGLCIQLKPERDVLPGRRPDFQFYFIGFPEYHRVRLQVTDYIERHYPAEADDILLAFHEAAGNALRHGSDQRPVFIRIRDYSGFMSIRIKDSGQGFGSQPYLDSGGISLEDKDLLAQNGRGIGIMRKSMDFVRYSRKGNEVLLVKKIGRHKN